MGPRSLSQGSLLWVESDQTKYCTEVLKRPISLKFYRNFTSVIDNAIITRQKSGYEQLQRPGTQTNCVSSTKTLVASLFVCVTLAKDQSASLTTATKSASTCTTARSRMLSLVPRFRTLGLDLTALIDTRQVVE